eukprot:863183_1
MIQILSGARKLGYSESETIFWRSHIDIDLKHGKEWFIMLDDILKVNNKKSFDIIYGGLFLFCFNFIVVVFFFLFLFFFILFLYVVNYFLILYFRVFWLDVFCY